MPLTTLSNLKLHLGINNNTEDTFLYQLLLATEQSFKSLVGWELEQKNYTEYYSGLFTEKLVLRQTPVNYITNIWAHKEAWLGNWGATSGAFPTPTLLTQGEEYALIVDGPNSEYSQSGVVVRLRGWVWEGLHRRQRGYLSPFMTAGQGNIKVEYNAGYVIIPFDIQLAIWQSVALLRTGADKGGLLTSEGYEGYSYSLSDNDKAKMTQVGSVQTVIQKYRKKFAGVYAI